MRDLLLGPWHGISTEDDQYKLLAGRDKNAANNLYMFDDGDVSPSVYATRTLVVTIRQCCCAQAGNYIQGQQYLRQSFLLILPPVRSTDLFGGAGTGGLMRTGNSAFHRLSSILPKPSTRGRA